MSYPIFAHGDNWGLIWNSYLCPRLFCRPSLSSSASLSIGFAFVHVESELHHGAVEGFNIARWGKWLKQTTDTYSVEGKASRERQATALNQPMSWKTEGANLMLWTTFTFAFRRRYKSWMCLENVELLPKNLSASSIEREKSWNFLETAPPLPRPY